MPYGNLLADVVQGSTANTPPVFKDGNGAQVGMLCRAWVSFNGAGTVTIKSSFNVSSITDNAVGDYTVNFTTALPDTNYSNIFGSTTDLTNGAYVSSIGLYASNGVPLTKTTTAIRVCTKNQSWAQQDTYDANVAIFR